MQKHFLHSKTAPAKHGQPLRILGLCLCLSGLLLATGCESLKWGQADEKADAESEAFPPEHYDAYLTDLPQDRQRYKELGVRARNMVEVSSGDLPIAKGVLVRRDSFSENGQLLRSFFWTEAPQDSVIYIYEASGLISKVMTFKGGEAHYEQYLYDKQGLMQQLIQNREEMVAYDAIHDKNGKITDLVPSDDSPTPTKNQEIYRYDSRGRFEQALRVSNNVIMGADRYYYDDKGRLARIEERINGTLKASTEYNYDFRGLVIFKKESLFLSEEHTESRLFEFNYSFYPES